MRVNGRTIPPSGSFASLLTLPPCGLWQSPAIQVPPTKSSMVSAALRGILREQVEILVVHRERKAATDGHRFTQIKNQAASICVSPVLLTN